ncbi:myosin-binding protein 3 [Forsythia ovata]|uniref:Myosin-binding protein 3 n=1 Tax=Forsythia ovata TaxID=205694 RepID=A0ABD1XAJ3_9LAMI
MIQRRNLYLVLGDCEEFLRLPPTKGSKEDQEDCRILGLVLLHGEEVISLTVEGPSLPGESRVKAIGVNTVLGPIIGCTAGCGVPTGFVQAQSGLAEPVRDSVAEEQSKKWVFFFDCRNGGWRTIQESKNPRSGFSSLPADSVAEEQSKKVDHIFEPAKKNKNLHRDLLCEVHAKEISKLGYCLNHQKLVDSQDMCEDCLSSRPEFHGVRLKCSCCGVILDNNIYSSYTVMNPSWDVLECANKEKLIDKSGENDNHVQEDYKSYEKISDFVTALCDVEHGLENENGAQILSDFDRDLNVTEKEIEDNGSIFVSMSELKELEGEEDEKVDVILEMEEEKETITMKDKSVQVSY